MYKWYISGIHLYGTYHLLREPGNSIDKMVFTSSTGERELSHLQIRSRPTTMRASTNLLVGVPKITVYGGMHTSSP